MDWTSILTPLIIFWAIGSMMMATRSSTVRKHGPKLLGKTDLEELGPRIRLPSASKVLVQMLNASEKQLRSMPDSVVKDFVANLSPRQKAYLKSYIDDER